MLAAFLAFEFVATARGKAKTAPRAAMTTLAGNPT
jgi:hypothetical protein